MSSDTQVKDMLVTSVLRAAKTGRFPRAHWPGRLAEMVSLKFSLKTKQKKDSSIEKDAQHQPLSSAHAHMDTCTCIHTHRLLTMIAHTCNPSARKGEAVWLLWIWSHPGIHSNPVSKEKQKQKQNSPMSPEFQLLCSSVCLPILCQSHVALITVFLFMLITVFLKQILKCNLILVSQLCFFFLQWVLNFDVKFKISLKISKRPWRFLLRLYQIHGSL